MTSSARQRTVSEAARYLFPLAVLCCAASLSLFVLPALAEGIEATIFATALMLDFMVVPPVLVYLLLVRTRRVPWTALVPTIAAGYAFAAATLPGEHRALLGMARLPRSRSSSTSPPSRGMSCREPLHRTAISPRDSGRRRARC